MATVIPSRVMSGIPPELARGAGDVGASLLVRADRGEDDLEIVQRLSGLGEEILLGRCQQVGTHRGESRGFSGTLTPYRRSTPAGPRRRG